MSPDDLRDHFFSETTDATWHTHPGGSSTLSVGDYKSFQLYSHLRHYVIGEDGVTCYKVDTDGAVVICE